MLAAVAAMLADDDRVAGVGCEAALIDDLQAREFAHFGGDPALETMVSAYRANPDQAVWEKYHYNVRAMIELAFPPSTRERGPRTDWKSKCKELGIELLQMKAALSEARQANTELRRQKGEAR